MKYIELTVHTTTEASEILSDIMWNYTDYGVTICDRADIIAMQTAKETTFWDYMDDELEEGGTLIVVPALAFDRHGFRLGYGGGYYDRLLAKARCASVGLAFHETLLRTLPREAWDRPVTAVCTEEEMLCL
jgi:5-formyltetrahydrofolate cyclo-ligase